MTRATREAKPLDIVGAMNHPRLFEPFFRGESWDGWRSILKAAFCLPMTAEELQFFRSVAERDPPEKPVRELWAIAGRRAGKDSIASLIGAFAAAFFRHADRLRPNERPLVLNLATDRDQARICLGYTKSFFTDIPALASMVVRETKFGFELSNSVDVIVGTNDFRAVRGRAIACAILDECAFYSAENSANPDVELYRALTPGMATLPGSMLIGISSPYRRGGLLWQKFKDHYGKPGDVLVVKAPSKLLNPTLDQSIIDQALIDDPEAARSEWLGEFRNDLAAYIDLETIEAAVDRGITTRPVRKDVKSFAFLDPSGGMRDSFTCATATREKDGAVVLDCLIEVRAPFNPTQATEHISAALKERGITTAQSDKYGAAWIKDAFAKCGITVRHSDRDRSQIYLDALPLFTSGRARLLDNKRLVSQFAGLERRTSPIGKDRIDHGPGGHDDLCNAAAGAMVLAAATPPPGVATVSPVMVERDGSTTSVLGGATPRSAPQAPVDATRAFYQHFNSGVGRYRPGER
jgi:hypothetical protein